ncbi:hypothetical protein D8B22_20585, partial [Verminephrobacter aporrectodeae subsp. tuberculatae]
MDGQEAASRAAPAVLNDTRSEAADTTPPAFHGAVVTGNQLVLTYTEAGTLNGAALAGSAGFTVNTAAGTAAITVRSAVVSATAKTVTLTLSRAVTHGETVSVSYTKPATSAVVRDAAGNEAVSFSDQAVTNNTPASNTSDLTASITLSEEHLTTGATTDVRISFSKPVTGFTRDDVDLTQANGTLSELILSGDGRTWRATFTPTANVIDESSSISVDLRGVTDAAGVAGTGRATSDNFTVSTVPLAVTITLADTALTVGETTTVTFAFNQGVLEFSIHNVMFDATTSTLGPLTTTDNKTWTASLTPTANCNDATNTIRVDLAGVADLGDTVGTGIATSANYTVATQSADTTPPAFHSATVTGDQLVLRYTEAGTLDAAALAGNAGFAVNTAAGAAAITVSSAVVNGAAKTVTLTLSRAVAPAETLTVSYTKPESGAVVQDAGGNDAANFSEQAVTHGTPTAPSGTQGPTLAVTNPITIGAGKLGFGASTTVTIRFSEAINVSSFTIADLTVGGGAQLSRLYSTDGGTNWKVTLSAPDARAIASNALLADGSTGNTIRVNLAGITNRAGTAGVGTVDSTVTYDIDVQSPSVNTATVTGNQLVLTYTEAGSLYAAALAGSAGFAVNTAAGAAAITVSSAVVNATAKTVTLTLSRAVTHGETVSVSYTKPATSAVVRDAAGNQAVSFSDQAVTNNTPASADTTPPQLITTGDGRPRVVTGNLLALNFSDQSNMVAALDRLPASGDFTVLVDGVANTVTNVSINGISKDMILTLTTSIEHGQRGVTVAYNDSTPADNKGIQDTAGNRLTSIPTTAVDNLILDRTPPVIHSATVTGNQLVLTYTEAGTLDGAALAGNAGFTVNTAAGTAAITVSSAVVSATAKTVTLTLSRAVTSSETVRVSYTKPESGAVVQDAAGNDAANFSERAVTNNTPAPADTTPPQMESTRDYPSVLGNILSISFSDTNNLDVNHQPAKEDFTVYVNGNLSTVNRIVMTDTNKVIMLVLSTYAKFGERVTIAYNDSTPDDGKGIQDTQGNRLVSIPTTEIRNNTPAVADTTAPVINTAVVTGNQLVLTYTEANTLDAAALAGNAGFTVNTAAGATAITVTGAVVNATAKTVTLTLSRAVANTETVTVSYTKPESGNGVRDAAGNQAANFSEKPVAADTTPPVISTAVVTGNQLVLTYTEAGTLDPAALTGNAGFTIITAAGRAAITVSSAVVGATAKTVTLTLSRAVAETETVVVRYTKPESGNGVRDAAGNQAANFNGVIPTHGTPAPADTTAPEFHSATVTGNQLVLTYTEAGTLDGAALAGNAGFTVNTAAGTAAIIVSSAVVSATTKTVTLTLSRAVAHGETVTVSYTKPASGAVVQDAAGNDAVSFSSQAVTNNTPAPMDTTPPVFSSAVVTGDQLVISYTEAGTLDGAALAGNAGFTVNTAAGATAITVSSALVNATAKTVTLTLSRAVTATETVTVSYTKPASGAVVQDAAGNDAVSFSSQAVTNNTPAPTDTTPPVFSSASVNGDQLVISYTEANTLDGAALAGNAGYAVNTAAGATAITVRSAVVNATAKTVTLTLSRAVASTETVTVSYTKPASGAVVQDAAGNDAVSF